MVRTRGFSLVELTLVIAIIAVLSAIAIPRYARSIASYRAATAAQRIAWDINLARDSARSASSSQTITFRAAGDTYVVSGLKDFVSSASTASAVRLTDDPYLARLGRITLSASTLGGGAAAVDYNYVAASNAAAPSDNVITFDGFGTPDRGGTIQVVSGSTTKTVTIDAATGRATVQ